jgi:hypothetical protein
MALSPQLRSTHSRQKAFRYGDSTGQHDRGLAGRAASIQLAKYFKGRFVHRGVGEVYRHPQPYALQQEARKRQKRKAVEEIEEEEEKELRWYLFAPMLGQGSTPEKAWMDVTEQIVSNFGDMEFMPPWEIVEEGGTEGDAQ